MAWGRSGVRVPLGPHLLYNHFMKLKLLTLLVLPLFLSACGPVAQKPPEPPKNVFTSIKDAVTKQLLLKCEYKDNDSTTITYIKGNMIRMVGTGKEVGIEGIIKDGKFYLWNTTDKKGMTLDLSKMEGAKMGETPIKSSDDVVNALEAKKENCALSPESASMFDLPADVTFTATPDLFGSSIK
jgi:hypothetical protein